MAGLDFIALPTTPTIYRVADLEREPVLYNSHLGHYTNFVNFFGLCALALPAGFRPDGMPFGVTLIGAAHCECTAARTQPTRRGVRKTGNRRAAALARAPNGQTVL